MIQETINVVKETEEKADKIVKEAQQKAESLIADRKELYRLSRTVTVKSDEEKTAEVKSRIAVVSKEIARLRKEVSLCDGIALRSGVIKEKLKSVREDEQTKGKEKNDYEHIRRRSRTDR